MEMMPNPSVDRTHNGETRMLASSRSAAQLCTAHVKRWALLSGGDDDMQDNSQTTYGFGHTMIFLDVIGASLTEDFGDMGTPLNEDGQDPKNPISKSESNTHLRLRVKLSEDDIVKISTGEKLQGLEGFVHLCPQASELPEEPKDIGTMKYFGEEPEHLIPASYHIEVSVPKVQFQNLIAAARLGRVPSWIMVKARGMQLPDEFSMKWDITSSPCLNVAAISLSIPLTAAVEGEELSPSQAFRPSLSFPPTQSQIRRLSDDIAALREVTKDIVVKMKWLVVLVAAFGAFLLAEVLRPYVG